MYLRDNTTLEDKKETAAFFKTMFRDNTMVSISKSTDFDLNIEFCNRSFRGGPYSPETVCTVVINEDKVTITSSELSSKHSMTITSSELSSKHSMPLTKSPALIEALYHDCGLWIKTYHKTIGVSAELDDYETNIRTKLELLTSYFF